MFKNFAGQPIVLFIGQPLVMATIDYESMVYHLPDLEVAMAMSSLRGGGQEVRLGAFMNGVPAQSEDWFQLTPLQGYCPIDRRFYIDVSIVANMGITLRPGVAPVRSIIGRPSCANFHMLKDSSVMIPKYIGHQLLISNHLMISHASTTSYFQHKWNIILRI